MARRDDEVETNLGIFNPEGVASSELLATLKRPAQDRYSEFLKCAIKAMGSFDTIREATASYRLLQDPSDDQDKSCGPRVVAAIAHALLNPQTMGSRIFKMDEFTEEMTAWNESSMRDVQARALMGMTRELKRLHGNGGPDVPGRRVQLYQKTPTV